MNRRKYPSIKEGGIFVTNISEKASLFNNFFAKQCSAHCQTLSIVQTIVWKVLNFFPKIFYTSFEILIQTKLMVGFISLQ